MIEISIIIEHISYDHIWRSLQHVSYSFLQSFHQILLGFELIPSMSFNYTTSSRSSEYFINVYFCFIDRFTHSSIRCLYNGWSILLALRYILWNVFNCSINQIRGWVIPIPLPPMMHKRQGFFIGNFLFWPYIWCLEILSSVLSLWMLGVI